MSSPSKGNEEPSSSKAVGDKVTDGSNGESAASVAPRPPAKRPLCAVIEISDTDSDDSDVCAVNSYQASADEVKRIRGDDYSSSSSSSDYSSDSESPWEDDSIIIDDDKVHGKAIPAELYPRANRMEDPKLNSKIKSQEILDKLSTHWNERKDLRISEFTLTCDPFRLCLVHDFLANPDIINNIVDDMNTLDWSRKKMDLYEFHQTADLASLTWQRSIRGIYELLKTEVMSWVSQVTGLELTSVSASCSLYGPGDHLLVHDDMLGDRRVAFILYLAPWKPNVQVPRLENGGAGDNHVIQVDCEEIGSGWSSHMGGALELLATDDEGRPTEVVHQVYPRNNMLAFFKVGTDSFHQVNEVLSFELPRLSINGWFHGAGGCGEEPPPPHPPPPPLAPPDAPLPLKPHNEVVLMNQWIDATYMSPRCRAQVQAQMERDSEVCLRQLLLPLRCRQLLDALGRPEVEWEACGPADRRRHSRVAPHWALAQPPEHAVRALLRLAASAAFCRLLADCTDLALGAYERLELQRWAPGDFTLLPPREVYAQARLEAVLYLGAPPRTLAGGATVYVAPEEPCPAPSATSAPAPASATAASPATPATAAAAALVTLPPHDNALNLVYCDAGAASFTKYLSKLTMRPDEHFYILTCTYRE